MPELTTITPKFQVHIPVSVRQKVGLTKHGKAEITTEGDKIIIKPLGSRFMALAGRYKVKKPIPAEDIRRKINYSR